MAVSICLRTTLMRCNQHSPMEQHMHASAWTLTCRSSLQDLPRAHDINLSMPHTPCSVWPYYGCPWGWSRYGDSLRSGWRNVLDFVVRLHKLALLPGGVLALEAGDGGGAPGGLPRPAAQRRGASSSLLSRAFARCLLAAIKMLERV